MALQEGGHCLSNTGAWYDAEQRAKRSILMPVDNKAVIEAALASPLLDYPWKGRGVAPYGYTKGMAVAFAGAYRLLRSDDRFMLEAAKPRTGDPDHDVLDHYAPELAGAGANDATPAGRLISVFTVMMGLGMRESSGKHCEGPDKPQSRGSKGHPIPTTPENAEAGLFQVSYDSIDHNSDRQALLDTYVARNDLMDVFGQGVRCVKPNYWPADVGYGVQAAFQNQMKECPLFAALYTAMLLRQDRGHWGPINRRRAEAKHEALVLFGQIEAIVDFE